MASIITILNTSIGSLNVGDEIIVDAVRKVIDEMFAENFFIANIPTHDVIGKKGKKILSRSKYSFVAGTNLLSSKYRVMRFKQWSLKLIDFFQVENIVLMGVGWTNYQEDVNFLAKLMYRNVLHNELLHSVRDNYTKLKLASIGIKNVVNTGCPTLWELTPSHCRLIPTQKGKNVITTITDYRMDKEKDGQMLEVLKANYDQVYIWFQGSRDETYFDSLPVNITAGIVKISSTLKAFDKILAEKDEIDYVGTRLHAGIHSMKKTRRSIIIGVDNRAIEMKKDFSLNVIERENIRDLDEFLNSNFETKVNLDFKLIQQWKNQFNS